MHKIKFKTQKRLEKDIIEVYYLAYSRKVVPKLSVSAAFSKSSRWTLSPLRKMRTLMSGYRVSAGPQPI